MNNETQSMTLYIEGVNVPIVVEYTVLKDTSLEITGLVSVEGGDQMGIDMKCLLEIEDVYDSIEYQIGLLTKDKTRSAWENRSRWWD